MSSPADEVGSLAEEAARLWAALGTWAGDQATAADEAITDLLAGGPSPSGGEQAGARAGEHLGEHADTGCTACPLCRAASALRRVDPVVVSHLGDAASSLAKAAAAMFAPPDLDRTRTQDGAGDEVPGAVPEGA